MHVTDRLEAYIAEIRERFPTAHPADVFALARDTINFELDVADPSFRKSLAREERRVNSVRERWSWLRGAWRWLLDLFYV